MGIITQLALMIAFIFVTSMLPYSSASFCLCKSGLQPSAYQTAIDYACGHGADCGPIAPNGQCYNANGLQGHCSYASNNYYQKNAGKGATCDFQGAAVLTNSDPSGGGCSYSAGSGSTSTGTTSPTGSTPPVTNVPTTSPTTPVSGGGGGIMPVTPVSGTGTPTTGTSTGSPTSGSGTSTGTGTGTGTGTSTNPTTGSPYSTTPNMSNSTSTGVLGGGMGTGMAPTGSSMDDNQGITLEKSTMLMVLVALVISALVC